MLVFVNDHPRNLSVPDYSVVSLLKEMHREHSRGLAVAVNGNVIPQNSWSTVQLKEHDQIILIQATQGG
jgi:sulfur carrier protein